MRSLVASAFALLALVPLSSRQPEQHFLVNGESFDGFSSATPPVPYNRHYDLFYRNLPTVQPCVLVSNVAHMAEGNSPAEEASLSAGQVSGCVPPPSQEQYMLYPFTQRQFADYAGTYNGCHVTSASSSDTVVEGQRLAWLKTLLPPHQGGVTLVLTVEEGLRASFNLSCIVQYLVPDLLGVTPSSPVLGIFYQQSSESRAVAGALVVPTNTSHMGSRSPLSDFSTYGAGAHRWIPQGTDLLWHGVNLTIMALGVGGTEWQQVQERAFYNWQQVASEGGPGSVDAELFPKQVSQTLFPMFMNQHPTVQTFTPFVPSCLTQTTPFPTCLPLGGQSAWGTTEQHLPSLELNTTQGVSNRGQTSSSDNKIAIMVSLSSTAFIHDQVPGADAAASGATALSLIVDAVSRSLSHFRNGSTTTGGGSLKTPQIYFFYFWGEDYGLSGSGRFVKELNGFTCDHLPPSADTIGACMHPQRYTSNFTGIDLDAFKHIIHIDQVGLTSDLYFHADTTLSTQSPAQKQVDSILLNLRVKHSSVGQIPPGPLMSFFRNATKAKHLTQSYTTISGYNTEFLNPNYQTSDDLPQFVSVKHIINAARRTAQLLEGILNNGTVNSDDRVALTIDVDLASTLWTCFGEDLGCSYFREQFGFGTPPGTKPNYYPSIYMRYQHIAQVTQFARYFMILKLLDVQMPLPAADQTENPGEDMGCPCPHPELQWCHNAKCFWRYGFLHASYSPFLMEVPVQYTPIYLAEDLAYRHYEATNPNGAILHPQIWVESFWDTTVGARLAIEDSLVHGGLQLMTGIFSSLATAGVLFAVHRWIGPRLKA